MPTRGDPGGRVPSSPPMTTDTALETKQLRKEYGALVAVDDVSIQIQERSLHSIIGPNGAGKTTLFNLLSGTVKATSGSVLYRGKDITDLPAYRTIHEGIGRSYQITNVFPLLSVFENVRLAAQALGSDNFRFWRSSTAFPEVIDRTWEVLERVGLKGDAPRIANTLPHGDQRKLELGMILAPDPDVLLLDEPTAGMASNQVPELMHLITEIQTEGEKTVLLVEHNMNVVMGSSDRITVMHQGAVLAEGTPDEIRNNELVQEAYLGSLYEDGES